jgi:hypothetical protein
MEMAETRTPRELQSREATARTKSWKRPELLPEIRQEPGWKYRWVRVSTMGDPDPMNTSSRLREGWEPVKASDHPEAYVPMSEDPRFKDNLVIGGLMLCKTPAEFVEQRNSHFSAQTQREMESVDQNFMRENDPRMPLFRERKTKVTFGPGN